MIVLDTPRSRSTKFVLRKISELPTLPTAFYRMLDAMASPRTSMKDISLIVSEDPALTSKMLRLANSPYYGFQQKVLSIDQAMVLLGVETVKALALSVSVFNTFHDANELKGIDKPGLWTHFLAVALCSKEIAAKTRVCEEDIAFTAGIMHDIGRLALLRAFPSESVAIAERAKEGEVSLIAAEEEALGLDHQGAGGFLAEHWRLPRELQDVISSHHDKRALSLGPLAGGVYLSDKICQRLGLGWTGDVIIPEVSEEELNSVRMNGDKLTEVEKQLSEKEAYMKQFFDSIW